MKTFQEQNAWILQMLMYETGRRRLTIAREIPQPVPRRRAVPRRNIAVKVSVRFVPEELSGFMPVIRTIS
ncbi:MAG: hypothetical protein WAO02_12720 [Verrucomicrobiia bacterium]